MHKDTCGFDAINRSLAAASSRLGAQLRLRSSGGRPMLLPLGSPRPPGAQAPKTEGTSGQDKEDTSEASQSCHSLARYSPEFSGVAVANKTLCTRAFAAGGVETEHRARAVQLEVRGFPYRVVTAHVDQIGRAHV